MQRAFSNGTDSQPRMLMEIDGFRFGPGGSTAPDVRVTRPGADVLAMGAGDAFRLGTTTTAARPSAATAGAGAMMFDTDLGKIIVSNGSAWQTVTSS